MKNINWLKRKYPNDIQRFDFMLQDLIGQYTLSITSKKNELERIQNSIK
jgi:hypothetical protein